MGERSIHVLLVDDDPDYARLFKDVLLDYPKFRLSSSKNFKTAMATLEEHSFDIILLDLNLPDSRGLETFEKVHDRVSNIPILILTGLDDEALALIAVSKGAQDYVVKGQVDPAWIVRMMKYAIERKRSEDILTHEQGLLRSLMDNITDHIYFKDEQSRFIRISKNHADVFKLKSTDDAIGKTDFDFFTKEHAEKAFKDEQRILQTGEPLIGIEEKETWLDGRESWASTTKIPLRDKTGKIIGTFGISRDITDRKLATEQLKKSEKALRAALEDVKWSQEQLETTQQQLIQTEKMRSVGVLAAGVAHEVKNPLAIILLGIEYLAGKISSSDPNVPLVLKDIQDAIKRADLIVRGLVDFSASRDLDLKPENLNDVVDDALMLVKHEFLKSHLVIKRVYSSKIPKCLLDRTRAQQVFINVFLNAVHAMEDGGELSIQTHSTKITTTDPNPGDRTGMCLRKGDEVIVVEIEDTGCGISKDKISKIFDPFFTTKASGNGTGLGLSVAHGIVELHGGKIDIRNRKEGGVCVRIMFKAQRSK